MSSPALHTQLENNFVLYLLASKLVGILMTFLSDWFEMLLIWG